MASKSIAFFLVLVLATCSLVLILDVEAAAAAADCKLSSLGCLPAESAAVSLKSQNRKMVAGLKEQKELLVGVEELRKVPSGPDPLHHNGNAPNKPRSDP